MNIDLLINIALLALGFLGALVAFGGETWEKSNAPLLKRITARGWLSISFLTGALLIGVLKEIRSNASLAVATRNEETLRQNLGTATAQLASMHEKLTLTRQRLAALEPSMLDAMYRLTERIERESDFAYVALRGRVSTPISSETGTPLKLYGGDEFEYHTFCQNGSFRIPSGRSLILEVGSQRYPMSSEGRIRILGPIGVAMPAMIFNASGVAGCSVKIIVRSTDRTRNQKQFRDLLETINQVRNELAAEAK
ncbi:hypothetical protein [Pseudomonas luteola]|uniref:hypothetical protein n=1 Tax=Pseudomonas luteola TaxID=47886 RepID=UPI00091CA2D3|nr:hypothetical protein [Pseudomonas zeshuii]SHJ40879.1 hypothetical protein SAMN05216295_1132 [Pseudomonas zeshuii]